MMGVVERDSGQEGHDEQVFWLPVDQPPLCQHLPLSFLHHQLADSLATHSTLPAPYSLLACLIICFPKQRSFPDGMCFASLRSLLDKLPYILNTPPPHSRGKHKNVIFNCLEIGVRISYPWALKTNWVCFSWLVKCSGWPASTSARPDSLCAHMVWFYLKKLQW